MDEIEAFDWGVYSHFASVTVKKYSEFHFAMGWAYYLSSPIGVGIIILLAALLFWFQGKRRSAVVTLISFALALTLIEGVRFLVPRRRPEDAEIWLGADHNLHGSYPSDGVLLFMLGVIL